jgi:rhomboid protease GluP
MIVSWVAIAACVVLFLLINRSMSPIDKAVELGALLPLRVKRGEYWRLLAAGFLHIQPFHLLMNMYALYSYGWLERTFGPALFAAILLLSIIGGNLLSVYLGNEGAITLGISGGLYGLLAAYMVLLFKLGLLQQPEIQSSLLRVLVINLVINLFPNVSRQGHAGGFLTGFVIAMLVL